MGIVELQHLSKTFGTGDGQVHALKDVSLSVDEGDIYGIIGMSGAGKSTLVRCINFLEVPTEGEVVVEGRNMKELNEREIREERARIGMIFQNFNLLMQKSVLDNVCFPLTLHHEKKEDAQKRAQELLALVELTDKAQSYPAQLSGGQRQRVAIARALASNPKILLCDEATSALDPQTTKSILALLKRINEELGITIIIITHQMSVVREICRHVAIIENGSLAEKGDVEEIFTHPKSRAGQKLIIGGSDPENASAMRTVTELLESRKIRIVFSENSSYEPVIANMVLTIGQPVNILRADTKNVGGTAKGEMILGLPGEEEVQEKIISYLKDHNLSVEEVSGDVF
ncbi:MAG: ATP-binding cassette domain-containing protein [Lachnospiraceae bacterium]|nr:ATP-binding cassette domain-containing protein [Lachnospiraceae bacterium]